MKARIWKSTMYADRWYAVPGWDQAEGTEEPIGEWFDTHAQAIAWLCEQTTPQRDMRGSPMTGSTLSWVSRTPQVTQ